MDNPDLDRYLDRQDNEWIAYQKQFGLSETEITEISNNCLHDFRDEHECWICGKVFDNVHPPHFDSDYNCATYLERN